MLLINSSNHDQGKSVKMGISKRIYSKTKTNKDLYYLQSLSLQHYRNFCYYLDLSKIRKTRTHGVIIYLKAVSIGKKIGRYFLLKHLNYSLIKFLWVEIFNYVNKALFYTT